jgi:hypothetical protein
MLLTTMHCWMTTNTLSVCLTQQPPGANVCQCIDKLQELAKLLLFTSSKESIRPVILSFSTKTVG